MRNEEYQKRTHQKRYAPRQHGLGAGGRFILTRHGVWRRLLAAGSFQRLQVWENGAGAQAGDDTISCRRSTGCGPAARLEKRQETVRCEAAITAFWGPTMSVEQTGCAGGSTGQSAWQGACEQAWSCGRVHQSSPTENPVPFTTLGVTLAPIARASAQAPSARVLLRPLGLAAQRIPKTPSCFSTPPLSAQP